MNGTVSFVGAVSEHQALLGGTDEFTIDAESELPDHDGRSWQAALDLRWPRAAGGPVEEAGLVLTSREGDELVGSFAGGAAALQGDEETGAERLTFSLRFTLARSGADETGPTGPPGGEVSGTIEGDEVRFTLQYG